jgi:hypothetical protein
VDVRARRTFVALLLFAPLLVSCTQGSPKVEPSSGSPSAIASTPGVSPPTTLPSSPPSAALISTLPGTCDAGEPSPADSVTFVAEGRAWAVAPDGSGLTCVFEVSDPGSYAWGPKADRVVVGGLEVRGVGSTASRPSATLAPQYLSWGRPVGKALVFSAGGKLEKALVGTKKVDDISPLADVSYRDVAYHPSGLAIAFVIDGTRGSAIWLSSNTGADPKRLVWSKEGTRFGALAFHPNTGALLYGAKLADRRTMIAGLDLRAGRVDQSLWVGQKDVLGIHPQPGGGDVVLDTGTGCSDRQAVYSTLDGTEGTPLLPTSPAPTTALGWLDAAHVLVAEGACEAPLRLWVVSTQDGGTPALLFDSALTASVRVAEPTPPPPLPDIGVSSEFA